MIGLVADFHGFAAFETVKGLHGHETGRSCFFGRHLRRGEYGAFLIPIGADCQCCGASSRTNQMLCQPAIWAKSDFMKLVGEDLTCERGERVVFRDVGFSVEAGELLVLKGPNGAGKTSLLRLIAGLIEPAAGRLALGGSHHDLTIGQQSHLIAHQSAVKPSLTVRENLQFWSDFLGGGDIEASLAAFALSPLAGYSAALLSAGQLRRLTLSRLKLVPRVLWLLDEPTVGLDANSTKNLRTAMYDQLERGGMIIATTHVDLGIRKAKVFDFADLEAS